MLILAICAGVMSALGCVPTVRDSFKPGLFSSGYGYDIRFDGRDLLPPTWRIENYVVGADGTLVHKDQPGYITTYSFEDERTGAPTKPFDAYTYALRFENRSNAGVIWLRNVPIPGPMRAKDLRVLMQRYVDGIAGASYETAEVHVHRAVVTETRTAATIVAQGPATLAGQPAYAATLELANLDQLKLDPNARLRRVELVFSFAPKYEVTDSHERYPVLVVAGYSNLPADFAASLPDFEGFLGRVTIAGASGYQMTPVAPASTPAAPAPAVSPSPPPAPTPTPERPGAASASAGAPVAPGSVAAPALGR